jgi:hypothetical protein
MFEGVRGIIMTKIGVSRSSASGAMRRDDQCNDNRVFCMCTRCTRYTEGSDRSDDVLRYLDVSV